MDVSDDIKGNLFLKHLMVLSDLGGEALNKLPPLKNYFKGGKMNYVWREKKYKYQFKVIHEKVPLTNASLRANGKSLLKGYALNDKMEDVIMLLLHGASSFRDTLPDDVKSKCVIGSLIGEPEELDKFVKQNYIRISRQLGGATSNALGQLAQDFVMEKLREMFGLHPLVMEDVVNTDQRPKMEDFDDYVYIVLKMFHFKIHKLGCFRLLLAITLWKKKTRN